MKTQILLLQIGELFDGHFNWRGLTQLILLILMGLIAVAFAVIVGYKAFQPKAKNKK